MKKYYLLTLIIISSTYAILAESAITYAPAGGRFGDCLVGYAHARYRAYVADCNFVYRPFKYSDCLFMHKKYSERKKISMKNVITYPSFPETGEKVTHFQFDKNADFLYVIPFFVECKEERERLNLWHFETDWNDKEFIKILREEISPIVPLKTIDLPQDKITLAVHVRRGGGFDKLFQSIKRTGTVNADKVSPLKFPPDTFYLESIRKISEFFTNQPIYVHIFTDDPDPSGLVAYYKRKLNKPNLTFGCREKDNHHEKNVLEDFFSLTKFDAIIRSSSSYSLMASKLGDYKIVISPANFSWQGDELVITESNVEISC